MRTAGRQRMFAKADIDVEDRISARCQISEIRSLCVATFHRRMAAEFKQTGRGGDGGIAISEGVFSCICHMIHCARRFSWNSARRSAPVARKVLRWKYWGEITVYRGRLFI